ncbi:MFS transporter [Dongshaea marina]|uniref:MFS transporter n=1 Tax=Dongshaea marina TaxID=2047966 RepID=UPI00131F1A06|nr:MFS transporter [Dongshaea marina]
MHQKIAASGYFPPVYILIFLYGFASFVSVLLAPSLPEIIRVFQISSAKAEWVMSVFLIGYAIAQLVFGPISNHYGRKTAALVGILLALIGSLMQLAAIFYLNFELLIWGRLINAFGAASGLVLGLTMVSDVHQGSESRRVLAILTLMQAFLPGVAIFIGGSLTQLFDLKASFEFQLLFNLFVLGCVFLLKETLPAEQHQKVHAGRVISGYLKALLQPSYFSYVALVCVASASIYVFNSFAPVVAQQYAGINSQQFGELAFITSFGLFFGAVIVSKFSHKYAGGKFLAIGISLILLASVLLLAAFHAGIINIYSIFAPAFILFIGIAFVLPNGSMMALSGAHNSALSAGLLSFLTLLTGAATVFVAGNYIGEYSLVLPLTLIVVAIIGVLLSLVTRSRNKAYSMETTA